MKTSEEKVWLFQPPEWFFETLRKKKMFVKSDRYENKKNQGLCKEKSYRKGEMFECFQNVVRDVSSLNIFALFKDNFKVINLLHALRRVCHSSIILPKQSYSSLFHNWRGNNLPSPTFPQISWSLICFILECSKDFSSVFLLPSEIKKSILGIENAVSLVLIFFLVSSS